MHLFEDYLTAGVPVADSWLSTLPYWILDWSHTDQYLQILIDEYNRNTAGGPDRRDIADVTTTNPEIPVGAADLFSTPAEPGIELSNLVIAEQELPLPPAPIGEETTMALTDEQWFAQMFPGVPYVPSGMAPPATLQGGSTMQTDFFGDLGDVFVDWVGQQVLDTPGITGLGPNVTTQLQTAAPITGAVGVPQQTAANCSPGSSPVYKKVCGVYKWVTPKRRRRRRLMTEGDYNDLLRIEGLKVNKNMTAAIAKALTR